MSIVLDATQIAAVLGVITGVGTTAGLMFSLVVKPLRNMVREFALWREDWAGEAARPGVPARAGVMERLANIEEQLRTNGGASLRDAVARIEQNVSAHLQAHAVASAVAAIPQPAPEPRPD